MKAVWFFFTVMLIVTMIASFLCYLFNQLQLAYTFIMSLFVGVSVEVVMFAVKVLVCKKQTSEEKLLYERCREAQTYVVMLDWIYGCMEE